MPPWLGWTVLALVFLDELLAVAALGYLGSRLGVWWWAPVLMGAAIGTWWSFASPKAPWGGPVVRPVAKVVVFGAACAGLWWTGHPGPALALLVFSVVVNAVALLPSVRSLVPVAGE